MLDLWGERGLANAPVRLLLASLLYAVIVLLRGAGVCCHAASWLRDAPEPIAVVLRHLMFRCSDVNLAPLLDLGHCRGE